MMRELLDNSSIDSGCCGDYSIIARCSMFPGKPLVRITWLDACSDSARMHHDHETLSNYILPTMCNVGYVLHENESRLILSHGKGSTGEIDFFAIPLACITDRLVISGEEETEEAEVDEKEHQSILSKSPRAKLSSSKQSPSWTLKEHSRNVHSIGMKVKGGWTQDILLLSDLHWDNPHCKRDILKQDLDEAVRRNAPIMIFGDLFCCMQGKYDKRSHKGDVLPEHQSGNYLDALVDTAADWLEPYKDNLCVIGDGNHETAMLKHHETDLLERLVSKLRDRGATNCRHGGYSGWVRIMTKKESGGGHDSVRMYYHHGGGGDSPVTKGAIWYNRQREGFDADIYVSGHIHRHNINKQVVAKLNNANQIELVKKYYVRCGTYKEEWSGGVGGWHTERGQGPRPLGGWWLRLSFVNNKLRYTMTETEGQ